MKLSAVVLLLALAVPAQAAPKHFWRDWKWWAGEAVIATSLALDAHSSCRGISMGYYEGNRLLYGSRSCAAVSGAAAGGFAFYTTLHALAWHCESNIGWKCYGLNQDDGKYRKAWQTFAYTGIPATAVAFNLRAAIHNYKLPEPNPASQKEN